MKTVDKDVVIKMPAVNDVLMAISDLINNLYRRGAEVFYEKTSEIHVSGHASQEELKLLINLLRPRFFVPVHGELRHLVQHAKLAHELGMRVVAEGVETRSQLEVLREIGIDHVQGNFISPPLTGERATELLARTWTSDNQLAKILDDRRSGVAVSGD